MVWFLPQPPLRRSPLNVLNRRQLIVFDTKDHVYSNYDMLAVDRCNEATPPIQTAMQGLVLIDGGIANIDAAHPSTMSTPDGPQQVHTETKKVHTEATEEVRERKYPTYVFGCEASDRLLLQALGGDNDQIKCFKHWKTLDVLYSIVNATGVGLDVVSGVCIDKDASKHLIGVMVVSPEAVASEPQTFDEDTFHPRLKKWLRLGILKPPRVYGVVYA